MSTEVQTFINAMNTQYDELHKNFENNFWSTKMNHKGSSADELTRTKNEYEGFLRDKVKLAEIRKHLSSGQATAEQEKTLKIMEKTYLCYVTESDEAARTKEETVGLESKLEVKRNALKLGYVDPKSGEFVAASSNQLRVIMRTDDDEARRKACYEGMCTIGQSVVADLCEIVKLRNKSSRLSGYEDYFEYKLQTTEGMSKKELFTILDDLEVKTRDLNTKAREMLVEKYGEAVLKPYNMGYMMSGDVVKESDPYYPFSSAVGAWARSFAALGIQYEGATMNLDLCAREKKYDNGFCHWPECAYVKPDGSWQPSVTNFTSLATPSQVGSGVTALATLMHEGGHAAHFANVKQASPFFVQERAPMSVAYAENQSMFLDSLVGDSDWLARYARSEDGKVIPWELIEKKLRQTHGTNVFACRSMLVVPLFEKQLYELPEDELTPENVMRIADEIDKKIIGGECARPVLSVPHILADESSCYYQGYILADMSVFQTRAYFLEKYGTLTDNPQIGKDLCEVYWRPGNSEQFLDLVKKLTGKPLTADDMVEVYGRTLESKLEKHKKAYEEGLKAGPRFADDQLEEVLKVLNMRIRLVHGDEVVSDTKSDGLKGSLQKYKEWLKVTFP